MRRTLLWTDARSEHSEAPKPSCRASIPVLARRLLPACQTRRVWHLGGGEGELAGGFQAELEGDLAVVAAGELEGGDLEEPFDGAEVGDDDLPVADGAGEHVLAHQ